MTPMVCQQCRHPMEDQDVYVEWLCTRNMVSLVETIRLVHPECQYAFSNAKTMKLMDLYDYWLPFNELSEFMEIVHECDWDDKTLAISFMTDYIKHRKLRLKQQKEGTTHEDDKS